MLALGATSDELRKYPMVTARLRAYDGPQCYPHVDPRSADYRVDVVGDAGSALGIVGEVVTESGALVLNGDLSLSIDAYAAKLSATGPVARDDGFRRAVSILATPTAEGFEIVLQGQL